MWIVYRPESAHSFSVIIVYGRIFVHKCMMSFFDSWQILVTLVWHLTDTCVTPDRHLCDSWQTLVWHLTDTCGIEWHLHLQHYLMRFIISFSLDGVATHLFLLQYSDNIGICKQNSYNAILNRSSQNNLVKNLSSLTKYALDSKMMCCWYKPNYNILM